MTNIHHNPTRATAVMSPAKCALEGCDTPTAGRRCEAHQRQLERNLTALASGR